MRVSFCFLALGVSLCGQAVPPGPGFVPFAGVTSGVGDGRAAVSATLSYPQALALDALGNLYIADFGAARVRKVTPGGIISTVAGTGVNGFSGDGVLATSAELSSPTGVALDSAGNIYIADGPNSRIRRVSPAGNITTFAGTGDPLILRPWQIAIDSKGNLYAADGDQTNVRKIDPSGKITPFAGTGQQGYSGDGGPATSAMIVAIGVAVDAVDNVLIAGGTKIRKVTPGGTISTFADVSSANSVFGGGMLSIAADGTVYMADSLYYRVVKLAADGTNMQTVAGTGVYNYTEGCGTPAAPFKKIATNAQLAQPQAVLVDGSGSVYIADSGNQRVRKVTRDGLITTIAGPNPGFSGDGGPASEAGLSNPMGMAFDSTGTVFIADSGNNRIRKITPDGVIHTIAGNGGPTSVDDPACFAPNSAFLNKPSAVAVDQNGNVFVADTRNNLIREIAADGTLSVIAGTGQAGYSGDGGLAIDAALNVPSSVAVDAAGNVFFSDSANFSGNSIDNAIREITLDGKIKTVTQVAETGGVAVDRAGNFYFGGSFSLYRKNPKGDVQVVAGTGDFQTTIVPGGAFNGPADLGVAASIAVSPDGTLAIADPLSHRVQRVSTNCTVDDPAELFPGGVAYDAKGNLYVSDVFGAAIWMLPAGAVPPPQGPTPMVGAFGFFNAASFELIPPGIGEPPGPSATEPLVPGEILILHGICMGPASTVFGHFDSNGVLPTQLAGTKVTFDGVSAPLLYVQSGLIELIAPYELARNNVTTMTLTYQGHSTSGLFSVAPGLGGIFTVGGLGFGQAAAANADGTMNSSANPVGRGKLIALYATGLGQTNPAGVDGKVVKGLVKTVAPVSVTIGGQTAKVTFAGDAPGFVGLSQINVLVPQGVPPGSAVPVSMLVNGNVSAQTVTIAVK